MKILSFDIEEWWSYDQYSIGKKSDYLPRLNKYLYKILDLLDEKEFQATFFCLGEVAEKYPHVIKDIENRGHDIGCHSFSHQFFGDSTYKEFFDDTYKALDIIQNITGRKVLSYRAPAFSITENNKWALGALIENGIKYDCSIFPATRSFGGFPGFREKTPCKIDYQGEVIKEFPMSITSVLGKELAYSGGGYFRLFPYHLLKSIMIKNDYVMTYFHLSDFDKEQPRKYESFNGESALSRYFKKYYGLNSSYSKFEKLLSDFEFVSLLQAEKEIQWDTAPLITLK